MFSRKFYKSLETVEKIDFIDKSEEIYYLKSLNPLLSRKTYLINHPSLLFQSKEDLNLLKEEDNFYKDLPQWLQEKIKGEKVISVNTQYPSWQTSLNFTKKSKWKINILALGDVGSTLAIGLKLLGEDLIEVLGLYDRNKNNLNRWVYELNQIKAPFQDNMPKAKAIKKDDLFNCDIFVFCASKGIPSIKSGVKDVRMAQFESNSKIVAQYARMARKSKFKGIFALVSDPVDLLCKVAFLESNKDRNGQMDFQGLSSNQIIGYGLGVMDARARFYSEQRLETKNYKDEGRAFGPHGQGLVIANSIINYNNDLSLYLTEKTIKANLEIRGFGYKPYVAPSLSSGALSLIATIKGQYFYGSTYMGGVYMGSKCKLVNNKILIDKLQLPEELYSRLIETYNNLSNII